MLANAPETTLRRRAVIYCRVSSDKQMQDGASLDYQEEKGHQYAELHGIDVILVLREAKSGYIHYSRREQLSIARQLIRDHVADMLIVWDLRRFSRNFVHYAMIFEEIESAGAEVVSVSENIDNSLMGKLMRSILAWSAESEREKIVEYANRHWQARLAQNLPIGNGRAPYGWQWGNKERTCYVIDPEEAAVRYSIFKMFVHEDLSVRGIAHRLTEDGKLPPAKSRGARVKSDAWRVSTVRMILADVANIGVLRVLKSKRAMTERGTEIREPNPLMRTIKDGIPPIVPIDLFEMAQLKLKSYREGSSRRYANPEDFLLKRHIFCSTCGYRMAGRYRRGKQNTHVHPFYVCAHQGNKYDACPNLPSVSAALVNQAVWEDCCRTFERLDTIRETLERSIEQSLQTILEDTRGRSQYTRLEEEIAVAKRERAKHSEGSYCHNLISQDIRKKEDELRQYEKEYEESANIVRLSNAYQRSVHVFLDFLDTMRGSYHEATFQEKRNALDVLGVRVYVKDPPMKHVSAEQEWLTVDEAAVLVNLGNRSLRYYIETGRLHVDDSRGYPTVIHRDELNRFLGETNIRPKGERENIMQRIEVTYSPIFTGVQSCVP